MTLSDLVGHFAVLNL